MAIRAVLLGDAVGMGAGIAVIRSAFDVVTMTTAGLIAQIGAIFIL
jgi:hypothetical protein